MADSRSCQRDPPAALALHLLLRQGCIKSQNTCVHLNFPCIVIETKPMPTCCYRGSALQSVCRVICSRARAMPAAAAGPHCKARRLRTCTPAAQAAACSGCECRLDGVDSRQGGARWQP